MTPSGPIDSVMVVGHGVMGRGIALSFARAGFRTAVWSRRSRECLLGIPEEVTVVGDPSTFEPDLAVEAVPEDVEIKASVFAQLESSLRSDVILATSTSGIPLEVLSRRVMAPERFVAIHYFMPAELFPLVEVAAGPETTPDVLGRVGSAMRKTGKEPILLRRPITGFIVNRLQHAILNEAYHLIESGVASADTIDKIARRLIGPRFCVNGMIEQKDIAGLEIHAAAQRHIVPDLERSGVPSRYLQDLVACGETGLKAGLGFFDWSKCDAAAVRQDAKRRLMRLVDFLETELWSRDPITVPRPRVGFDVR